MHYWSKLAQFRTAIIKSTLLWFSKLDVVKGTGPGIVISASGKSLEYPLITLINVSVRQILVPSELQNGGVPSHPARMIRMAACVKESGQWTAQVPP